jgi:eukaryotic-like serine/threonine-protein kinase
MCPPTSFTGWFIAPHLSPDGSWVLLAEMDISWWRRCRVVPFDASSSGKEVGPEGTCTWAQWSPDGKWMYFTVDTGSSGFHVWRQRFPDGAPEQVTPSGASEEEGLAMLPDGKSFVVAAGTQQSSIWLHDEKTGDKQITSEGYIFAPTLSPDGKKVYYLRRAGGSHSYANGELWVSDVEGGTAERLFPGLVLEHYSLSREGKKVVFTTEQGPRSGVWIAALDRTQPPRQLTFGGEQRAFFGRDGEIIYQGTQKSPRVMRMHEDGSQQQPVSDLVIMQLQNVSPSGRWALVGVTPPGGHGDRNTMTVAVPLPGGSPVTLCDSCTFGFGIVRFGAPFMAWTADEKSVFVPLRYFGFGTGKTLVIPTSAGSSPPAFVNGPSSEEQLEHLLGAQIINEDNAYPGQSRARYVAVRRSTKANLFRIYLPQ